MPDVFSGSSSGSDPDEVGTPGIRVATALTGDDEDGTSDDTPSPVTAPSQGSVDGVGQSYLAPAGADAGDPSENAPPTAASAPPASADTRAYMTPVAAPTLAAPRAFADHSADTAAMTAQKTAESKENIKPSVGRRILGALAGGAVSFGGGNGVAVDDEVLNRPAQQAQQQWAIQEAPIQAQLNADSAADEATTRSNAVTNQSNRLAETNYANQLRGQQDAATAASNQARAARQQQIDDSTPGKMGWQPNTPGDWLGGYHTTSVSGKPLNSPTPPASVQSSPEYRIAAAKAAGTPFTPEQQQIIRSGGKVTFRPPARPRQASAGEIALGQARAAFIRENGHPPQTLEDQNEVAQAAKGTLTGGDDGPNTPGTAIADSISHKNAWIDKHQLKTDTYATDPKTGQKTLLYPKGTFLDNNDNPMSAQAVKDVLDGFRTKLNNTYVMRKSGTMVDAQGNTVSNRFSRNSQAAQPRQDQHAATQQQEPVYHAKSGSTVTIGTRVIVNGRHGVVASFDAKGKPVVKY